MADEYDEDAGGGSKFVMGLVAGTLVGAGLGMLFAPKSGSELRSQISETASSAGKAASDQYKKASAAASNIADRGRHLYDRARHAVSRGTEEVRQQASEALSGSSREPGFGGGRSTGSSGMGPGSGL